MSENSIWYGYLEAGSKSTPVVVDQRLSTGRPETVYIFNMARNVFLEYRRDIVDGKLRELKAGEADTAALKTLFAQARKEFRPRTNRAQTSSTQNTASTGSAKPHSTDDEFEEFAPLAEVPDGEGADAEEDDWEQEDD